jgi:O-antigen/teichoic acid export membrane protein
MKNVAWSLANAILGKGFSFVFTVIIGNLLLPSELGLFVTLLLVITYGANIFSLNLGGGMIQKLNSLKPSEKPASYFTAGLMSMVVLSFMSMLVFYFLRNSLIRLFDIPGARDMMNLIYPLLILTMLRSYFSHLYQAQLRFRQLTVINMVADLLQVLVTLLLLYQGYGLKGIFWALYVSSAVALVPLASYNLRKYGLEVNRITLHSLKSLVGFSSIIFAGSIAVLLDQRIDLIFVAHFLNNQEVALYGYVLKFALLFILFGYSISKVTYPRFTQSFASGSADVGRVFRFSLNYTFFFVSIIAMLFLLHARPIIGLILPDFYIRLIPYLLILLMGVIPRAVLDSVGSLFTAKGLPSISVWLNWGLLAINIFLNLILIPRFGLYGAAVATTSSFLLKPLIMLVLINRKLKVDYPYWKLLANFLLFMLLMVSGYAIESYLLREIILVGYIFYNFKWFLSRSEQQYLWSELSRFNSRIIQLVRP